MDDKQKKTTKKPSPKKKTVREKDIVLADGGPVIKWSPEIIGSATAQPRFTK